MGIILSSPLAAKLIVKNDVWRRQSAKRFTIRRDRTFPIVHSSTRKGHTMRTRSLVVRCCATVILLAQLLIVISLFFPYAHYGGTTGWQELFPSPGTLSLDPLDPYYLSLIRVRAFVVLIVFALPVFAAVAVFRSPTRMMGLLGVWISLPLTLLSCFVCASIVLDPFNGYTIRSSPVVWFPPVGFALSFLSCIVLATYLPILRARQQSMGHQTAPVASPRLPWPPMSPAHRPEPLVPLYRTPRSV